MMALLTVPALAAPTPAGARGEAVKGRTVKRITLSESAVRRLGIETGEISKQPVVRRQTVGGLVVAQPEKLPGPVSGRFTPSASPAMHALSTVPAKPAPARAAAKAGDAWMLVTLTPAEWERVMKDRPARLIALTTREKSGAELVARPSGLLPVEDTKRSMLKVYYVVPGKDHGLTPNTRMRVELPLEGDESPQTVVPYGAIYYDVEGTTWVYVQTAPWTFERQRVGIERVIGDLAVLSEGPPVKTTVVTVGAALLYGAEILGK
jgi:hypothetical protein